MPFADEFFSDRVVVKPYQARWAREGLELVNRLRQLVPAAVAIDHIGSTAVPGLPAKDCLDAMIRVADVHKFDSRALTLQGFHLRPEPWNCVEGVDGTECPKRVFAPPPGGRSVNIHIRPIGSPTARYALLFRDFLRVDPANRRTWGAFKTRLAESPANDPTGYGQVKSSVQPLLMAGAESWATSADWTP
ncbi:MAG: GrpB family protein [Nakamurella sp.]